MTSISKEALRNAIVAAEEERLKHPAAFRPGRSRLASVRKNSEASQEVLSTFLRGAGLDLKRLEALHEERDAELARLVDRHKADALELAARRKGKPTSGIATQSEAVREAVGVGFFPHPTFTLDEPVLIWSIPLIEIVDSSAAPFASWAKFRFSNSTSSGAQKVGFYFFWQNPSSDFAVISAATFMSATGHLRAHAPWGISVNTSDVVASAVLNLWLGWPNAVASIQNDSAFLGEVGAYGSFFTGPETSGTSVASGVSLQTTMFAVPPGDLVVFEVAVELDYDNEGGDIDCDFASGDFQIACPVVVFSLLNNPPPAKA